MKKILFAAIVMLAGLPTGFSQSYNEKISKEFTFEKIIPNNTLIVANINGSIKVTGYNGDKIIVEVDKNIRAKTEARLERGKQELSLGIIDRADTIILYVSGLCNKFMNNKKENWNGKRSAGWGYDWNGCNDNGDWRKDEGYDHKFDFTIKVPSRISVIASTVNNGDILVEQVNNAVSASNVNGSIRLRDLTGATYASTINGDVDLDYSKNPDSDCRYYTLNGNINANFKKGLAANLSFESFNGSFYSNVPTLESLPVNLEKRESGKGVKYKVSGNRYKVGNGGVHLDFETFNGNVYLKEIGN